MQRGAGWLRRIGILGRGRRLHAAGRERVGVGPLRFRLEPQKRRDGERQIRRVILLARIHVLVMPPHGDERHAEAEVVVVVAQAVNFVVGDELDVVEILLVPALALEDNLDVAGTVGSLDEARPAGPQRTLRLHDAQRALEGRVVQVAREAELRVVDVRLRGVVLVEQVLVGVDHGRAVELERFILAHRGVGPFGADVREFRQCVDVLAVGLAAVDFVELGQQGGFADLLFFEVVAAQQLDRARRGLGPLAGDQAERVGQRIARRGAKRDPASRGAARREHDCGKTHARGEAHARAYRARTKRRRGGHARKRHRKLAAMLQAVRATAAHAAREV